MKTGWGVRCATAVAPSAARSSNAMRPQLGGVKFSYGPLPHFAACHYLELPVLLPQRRRSCSKSHLNSNSSR